MQLTFDKVLDFFDFNITLYCLLYTVTIFINKYILSTLKFTYPTVFQGWQTLIASLFLFVMKLYSDKALKQSFYGYEIISMVPNILFHVCGIVAGSKALSAIPIPVFLGTTNITNVAVLFSVNKRVSKFHFISGAVTFATSAVVMLSRQVKVSDVSNVWLIMHVFFVIVDMLYSNFMDLKVSRMKKLWYTNFFSVMILAPASLYLQEAFSALEFALSNKLKFYISVSISGICGGMAQVISTNIRSSYLTQAFAVTVTCILSQIVFTEDLFSNPLLVILIVNLISNSFLSFYNSSEKGQGELTVV